MSNPYAVTNEERKDFFERLSNGIDESKLTLNEYVFASADLLRSTFWQSQASGLNDEEASVVRERIMNTVSDVVKLLNGRTVNVAEDIIVLSTLMMEAANHVIMSAREEENVPAE